MRWHEPVEAAQKGKLSIQTGQSAKALIQHQQGWSSANKGWDFIKPKVIGLKMEHTGISEQSYFFPTGKKAAFPVRGFTQ